MHALAEAISRFLSFEQHVTRMRRELRHHLFPSSATVARRPRRPSPSATRGASLRSKVTIGTTPRLRHYVGQAWGQSRSATTQGPGWA
jgi:hypothetical protein